MVNAPFTYTPSGKKRAPSKEMVLRWSDRAWKEIPVDLIMRSFKSCGINNALDGTDDDLVWDDEEEEAEDAKEPIDNEFETDSEAEDDELFSAELYKQTVLFRATPVLFRTNKSDKVNDQCFLSFVYLFTGIYLHTHFSFAIIIREIWKSYILLHKNTLL